MRHLLARGLMTAVILLVWPTPAFASIGVGTDMRSIEVTQPLVAGGTYQIHHFTIINTGSQDSGFGIQLSATTKPGMRVPVSWLSFQPSAFYLAPRQGIDVAPTLHVSVDAKPGTYQVLLLGVPKLPGDLAPGGHLSVGVGPRLSFTVIQPNPWQRLYFIFLNWMPWTAIAALVILVIAVAAVWLAVWLKRAKARSRTEDPQSAPNPADGDGGK